MTKAELINIFSEKVGIGESDSRIFFEILLTKLSAILKSGQSIFIPEFGYFHLIKGKIKRMTPEEADNIYEELIDIILYSSEEKLSQSETEGFVFNVPSDGDETFSPLDSHFSLSIGKPLIPLRGYFDRKEYIPSSGYEYKKYLQTKVDELIAKSKIILSEEQFPTLIIDARSYNSNEVHIESTADDLDVLLSDDNTISETTKNNADENVVKNIAWDFGEILSQKISAESILDLTNERIKKSSSETIDNQTRLDNSILSSEQEKVLNKLLNAEKEEQDLSLKSEENLDKKNSAEKTLEQKPESDYDLLDKLIGFEEVQSDESTEPSLKKVEEDLSDDEFWKNTSKLFETFDPREIRSDDEKEYTEVKAAKGNLGEFSNEKKKIELIPDHQKPIERETKKSSRATIPISLDDEGSKPNKSKKWLFVIPVLLILIAIAFYYWYTQLKPKAEQLSTVSELSISSDNANIIERDYRIPISYPYITEGSLIDSVGTKSSNQQETGAPIVDQKSDEKNIASENVVTKKQNTESKNSIPDGRPVSLGKNIYKYGNIYVVQVASFRSNQIAENEAGKYRNKGYNAFIEPVEIKDKGLWYRIKVGNFASLQEAENFISKNIR